MREERNPLSSCGKRKWYARGERKVVYAHYPSDLAVSWGGSDDPRLFLVLGRTYEVLREDQYSWHSKIVLWGLQSAKGFPSVVFEEAE